MLIFRCLIKLLLDMAFIHRHIRDKDCCGFNTFAVSKFVEQIQQRLNLKDEQHV